MSARISGQDQCADAQERSLWRPIETAPKDAVEVLTFTPVSRHRTGILCGTHVGWWRAEFQEWCQSDMEWEIDPTHWMPLPAAPDGLLGGQDGRSQKPRDEPTSSTISARKGG
jgi:hypothetical protein